MNRNPYARYADQELILRDHLAVQRTLLANERTFHAYVRTALTLFIAGVTFIKFFDEIVIELLGWTFLPAGVLTFAIGAVRYRRMNTLMAGVLQAVAQDRDPA